MSVHPQLGTIATALDPALGSVTSGRKIRSPQSVRRSEHTQRLVQELAQCSDPQRRETLIREIILLNQVVATAVASRYRRRGVDQDDLDQVALEGLVKAVRRYDVRADNDLLTYAVPTIRGELQRYFRDLGWTIRPPRRVQELQWQVRQTVEQISHELGGEPDPDHVSESLGISREEYEAAMLAKGCFHPTSLDQPLQPGGSASMADLLPGVALETSAAEARAILAPVVRRLPGRDQKILYLRFFEELTQAEIGERIGVTQMQVSRLLTRILNTLRERIDGHEQACAASKASPPRRIRFEVPGVREGRLEDRPGHDARRPRRQVTGSGVRR